MKKRFLLLTTALTLNLLVMAQTKMVTFQVDNPASTPVYVAGSWNWPGWPGTLMTQVAPGKYSATIALAQSTTHEFLFVRDSSGTPAKEILLPTMLCTNADPVYTNRKFTLGTADTGLCFTWATCNACTVTPPPPPPPNVNVTFQVESPDSLPVSIIGSWNWTIFPGAVMTQVAPGKYSATLALPSNTKYEFKYVNGPGSSFETLLPTMACTNADPIYTNRVINVGANDTAICNTFSSCNTCTVVTPPSNIDVTFQVKNTDSTPVYLFGNWNNWSNYPGFPMTLNSTLGVYEVKLPFAPGSVIEYLFVNGVGTKEVMNPADACTNGNGQYTNRLTTLGNSNITLCNQWASCNNCYAAGIANTPTNNINVTWVSNNNIILQSTDINIFDEVQIFDITGKKVFANANVKTNQNIDVHLNSNSLYIIVLKNGENIYKIKTLNK